LEEHRDKVFTSLGKKEKCLKNVEVEQISSCFVRLGRKIRRTGVQIMGSDLGVTGNKIKEFT